jgi:hypothetical protein
VGFIIILLCACDVLLSDLRCFVCFLATAHWLLSLFLVSVRHLIFLLLFLFYCTDLLSSLLDQRILMIFFCHDFLLRFSIFAGDFSQLQVQFPHSVFSAAGCVLDLVSSFCCRSLLGRWSLRPLLGLHNRLI